MPANHTPGRTELRWRFPAEFLEHAIELRQRLKSRSERDFTDPQIRVSQEITRSFEPNARDILDKINAGYLLEGFAQVIRIHVDRFCELGQGKFFARVFFDEPACFPNRHRLSSVSGSRFFEFSCGQHLDHPQGIKIMLNELRCSSLANFSPDLVITRR
jgi:hypothetical protein